MAKSDVFSDQVVVLRSVLFLAFAVIAHLTRAVLLEQVGVKMCFASCICS